MTNKIRYVWTAEDQRIAGGNTDQSVQGPYVTPYGIRAGVIPKAATFSAGTEYEIDLDLSMSGEPWRARRFHEDKPAQAGASYFQWHDPPIPDGVNTLADLCKHLRETNPEQYPETIYGEKKLKATKTADNPAQMLFDYWKNSKYRFAVVKSGFDWRTYANDPGSIPVKKDGAGIVWVLRKVVPVPKAAAAPGVQKKIFDFSDIAVDHFIEQVTRAAASIRSLLALSERVLRQRFQVIYRMQALRALAEASSSNKVEGFASDGPKIMAAIDKMIPRLQKLLVDEPIVNEARSSEEWIGQVFKAHKEFTRNALADLKVEQEALHELLLTGGLHGSMLKKWCTDNHAAFMNGVPAVVSRVDRLTAAMAEGHKALAECGIPGLDDTLLKLLDKLKDGFAVKPEDIDGDSSTEVVLSFVGKGIGMTTTVVGNLAGPPSLSIAMLQIYGTLRFAKIAREAYAELNALPISITTVAIRAERWAALSHRLVRHIPDPALRAELEMGLLTLDRKKFVGVHEAIGEKIAGGAQQTVPWKTTMAVLGLLSTILAIREAANAPDNRHFVLKAIDFTSGVNSVASVSLGTYESVMTELGLFEKVSDAVTKAGTRIGVIGGILGALSGAVAYVEAAKSVNEFGMVSSYLGVLGSTGMAFFAAYTLLGTGLPVLAAVSLACLLASGAVSVAEIVESADNTKSKTQMFCRGLLASVRNDVLGRFVEYADATLLHGMEDLEKITVEGNIPNPANDYFVNLALAKAGFSDAMIKEVVNSSILANTPFGPSLAAGVSPL